MDVDPNCERVEARSNIALTRSDGSLMMNVDATPINRTAADAIPPHMTTPEEVRHKLAGSTRYYELQPEQAEQGEQPKVGDLPNSPRPQIHVFCIPDIAK